MMTLRVVVCAALALVFAAPSPAGPTAASWAQPQIKVVTAHGLMGGTVAGFRPDDPLTAGDLADLVGGVTGKPAAVAADPTVPVTIAQLDAQLVRGLGLLSVARQFTAGIRGAGLRPPSYFGTETVARLLGLRFNHPAAQDSLELAPDGVATRAEAAFSAARMLGFTGGESAWLTQVASTFQPAPVTGLRRSVLQVVVSLVGNPYVWGGTSEQPQDPFDTGALVPGGFDCSGFVWRVFKLQAYAGAEALAAVIKGRSTFAMSGEVPAARRLPGDRPRRHLPGRRLVRPGVQPGRRARPADRGVHEAVRLGPRPDRRSGPRVARSGQAPASRVPGTVPGTRTSRGFHRRPRSNGTRTPSVPGPRRPQDTTRFDGPPVSSGLVEGTVPVTRPAEARRNGRT
jgi:cell wall-associated NlpC family hydrolase